MFSWSICLKLCVQEFWMCESVHHLCGECGSRAGRRRESSMHLRRRSFGTHNKFFCECDHECMTALCAGVGVETNFRYSNLVQRNIGVNTCRAAPRRGNWNNWHQQHQLDTREISYGAFLLLLLPQIGQARKRPAQKTLTKKRQKRCGASVYKVCMLREINHNAIARTQSAFCFLLFAPTPRLAIRM
jgi:hypothetical protein